MANQGEERGVYIHINPSITLSLLYQKKKSRNGNKSNKKTGAKIVRSKVIWKSIETQQ